MPGLSASDAREILLEALALLPPGAGDGGIRPILLAVSGGPDSLALLLLAAENASSLRAAGFSLLVATVDHGLRPGSNAEAAAVARISGEAGLPHRTLRWEGEKPKGNLAASARDARYGLLLDHAERAGAVAVLTAHHEDDQIETHHLARARRAGDRGLAGMRRIRALSPCVALLRPFLHVTGAALKETVAARGLAAVDDPSNRDLRFDRARLRALLPADAATRAADLARIAAHAAARDRKDALLGEWMRFARCMGRLGVDERGVIRLGADAFRESRPEVASAFLSRALAAVGGALHPPMRVAVDALGGRMRAADLPAATLGGAVVREANGFFTLFREYGRRGLPEAACSKGCGALFDRRFKVFNHFANVTAQGARIVAFGATGRGGPIDGTLPLLVSQAGDPVAAHPALLAERLPGVARLAVEERVSFRLLADLP